MVAANGTHANGSAPKEYKPFNNLFMTPVSPLISYAASPSL